MPEQIIVKHEIDLGQLERFEKALKEFKDSGDVKKVVRQLAEMGELQDKINKKKQEEVGIVGKLITETKKLKQEQKETQDPKQLKEINSRLREIGKELKKNKETTTGWSKAIGSFAFKFNVLANVISNVASIITSKLNQALKGAIDTIQEFESAMAGVRAISQATDEEFKRLQQDAIRLGGATIYSARQVSLLQMAYAKLGFSTAEILNATEATLSLAAATDEDLAEAALVAGSTVRAFNMDVIETQRVVDVMAKSFTSSALNLEHWKESMKFASSIAEGTGLNVETLAAAMAILADRGIKGSIAGTSMKNILLRMGDASSLMAKKIGFAVNSSESFIKALEELNRQGISLTEVFALTDRRAAPAMRILIEMAEEVRKTEDAFRGAEGAAKDMADIRMDTLKGSLTIMKSAWEGLVLSIEQGTNIFTVHLRSIVDWLTKVIMKVKELTLSDEEWIKQFGEFEGSKKVQEFASTLIDSKDKTKAISEELKRVQEEYDRLIANQKEIAKLTKSNLTEEEQGQKKRVEWVKEAGNKIIGYYKFVTHGVLKEQEATAIAGFKFSTDIIDVNSKAFKKQKKEIDENTAILKAYITELDNWLKRTELLKKSQEEEEKEIIIKGITFKKYISDLQIRRKQEIELRKKTADITAEIAFEQQKRLIFAMELGEEETTKFLKEAEDEKTRIIMQALIDRLTALKRYFPEEARLMESQIKLLKEKMKNLGLEVEKEEEGPTGFLAKLLGITDADEKKMVTQLKKLGNFALNQFRDIANQQKALIDETIRRYDQQVSELERNLDVQLQLSLAGKANRLQLVQAELDETKKLRNEALIEQEKLMERQRKIENTIQALSLATTVAELLKTSSKFGPAFPIIAGILIGAMFKLWSDYMGKIEGKLPRFAEGVVGFKGKGTETSDSNLVLMSTGETMTSAKGTKKYRSILEGIHSDDINAIWNAVNNDRNFSSKSKTIVNVDLDKTNKLLGEIVQHNKEIPKNFGSYIEYTKEGIIYRIKFNDRKN